MSFYWKTASKHGQEITNSVCTHRFSVHKQTRNNPNCIIFWYKSIPSASYCMLTMRETERERGGCWCFDGYLCTPFWNITSFWPWIDIWPNIASSGLSPHLPLWRELSLDLKSLHWHSDRKCSMLELNLGLEWDFFLTHTRNLYWTKPKETKLK